MKFLIKILSLGYLMLVCVRALKAYLHASIKSFSETISSGNFYLLKWLLLVAAT